MTRFAYAWLASARLKDDGQPNEQNPGKKRGELRTRVLGARRETSFLPGTVSHHAR